MQIDQQVVNIELPAGGSAEAGFSIANAGAGTLEYLVFFQNDERDLGNSNISLNAYDYTPGETAGWLIELHNNGFDQEAITDLYITFPQQANLNIATPLNGGSGGSMVPDGSSGSGITLNWHGETEDGSGVLLPGESALGAVNVTMAADAPLSIILSVEILGDLGSNIFQEVELGNLSCGYITLDHNHGELAYAETSEILLDINAQNLSEGFYTQNLRILDHLGSEVVLPVQINVTASNEDDNQIQYITALNHIYPNPFNPSTSINFCLSETQFVKISIFNIKGQKVVELANSLFEAGYHTLTWQPDNSPSGVYLLNFSSADYNQSQKIILMK
jgi:hypothetical protein